MPDKKKNYPLAKDRQAMLTGRRNIKMARSAHAYVRGNTAKFYEWLDSSQGLNVPQGPAIWICGDCHIGNLGPIANAKGKVDIQIRDLDQTVIGNPAHDLIRLGLSLASAARSSDLAGVVTAKILEQLMLGYEQAFIDHEHPLAEKQDQPEVANIAMEDALNRHWKHLAKERLGDVKPHIPLGKKFWPLTSEEKKNIQVLFSEESVRRLITSLRSRDDDAKVKVLDAAYWMKGCSSLGQLRYVVLLGIGNKQEELCMVDMKEAGAAVSPRYKKSKMPKDNAMRVVEGARHLSPALGERMLAVRFNGKAVFLRELLPQDLKLEIAHLSTQEAMKVAKYLAMIVGKAHARQMSKLQCKRWQYELARNRSKTLDAPSWLWSSVVELLVSHEAAYLEHCRKYALQATA